jgi:protein involved in polysaccharide export with SLBB domain
VAKPVSPQQALFPAVPPASKEVEAAKVPLSPGDRVRWSPAFLATGRKTDPRWYEEHKLAQGRVDAVQRDGDVLVLWDGADTTTVHPPARLVRAGKT